MKNLVVLISGRGSNLEALLRHQEAYRVAAVVSDNPEARGLELARNAGVPTVALVRSDYPNLRAMKAALLATVRDLAPDLVALAGFMQIIAPEFIEVFESRLFNIHPSLLPNYPGLDTHARVIEAGEREHGCSVHLVDTGVDTGPLVAQARLSIPEGSTPSSLAALVLTLEHRIYPWVMNQVSRGEIVCSGGTVHFSDRAHNEGRALGFDLFGA